MNRLISIDEYHSLPTSEMVFEDGELGEVYPDIHCYNVDGFEWGAVTIDGEDHYCNWNSVERMPF